MKREPILPETLHVLTNSIGYAADDILFAVENAQLELYDAEANYNMLSNERLSPEEWEMCLERACDCVEMFHEQIEEAFVSMKYADDVIRKLSVNLGPEMGLSNHH